MAIKNKLLSILSDAEQETLYGLPDFDDAQRLEFLALDESELALACSHRGLQAQIYCIIQIAYFKAKHLFFRFGWDDVPDDCSFVLSRYFPVESLPDKLPYKQERYAQREKICALYGYRPWSSALSSQLEQQAAHIVHRDVTPGFVATELIIWLNAHKIIRPGYTTVQELVSRTLSDERQRLGRSVKQLVDMVGELHRQGIQFKNLTDAIDTGTPAGRFFFHVMASLAEMERELIIERTRAGLDAAKQLGRKGGRKPKMTSSKIESAKKLLASGIPPRDVAKDLGVSVPALYRWLPASKHS